MSESTPQSPSDDTESVYKEYILDVRILEETQPDAETSQYRFDAPQHTPITFDDPETATLYADIYFDTNGFQEAGTGDRGVPPEVMQAGRDTLAAYFLTMPGTDVNWVASFYGKTPPKIERYIASVRQRAQEIRANAAEQGLE